jgi:hypothetical protein
VKSNYNIIDVIREAWNKYVKGKELTRRDFGAGFRGRISGFYYWNKLSALLKIHLLAL